jgi:hypothetical protein
VRKLQEVCLSKQMQLAHYERLLPQLQQPMRLESALIDMKNSTPCEVLADAQDPLNSSAPKSFQTGDSQKSLPSSERDHVQPSRGCLPLFHGLLEISRNKMAVSLSVGLATRSP